MAKLMGPLFSMEAAGTIKKTITYQRTKAGNIARKWRKTVQVPNAEQITVRYWMGRAVLMWQSFNAGVKADYNELAAGQSMSGYNYFMSEYVKGMLGGGWTGPEEGAGSILVAVANTGYDGFEYQKTNWYSNETEMCIGRTAEEIWELGVIFSNIEIPQGATITEGHIEAFYASNDGNFPEIVIWGVDEDDCTIWSAGSRPSQRTKTAAVKSWDGMGAVVGNWCNTPDLKGIIEEIVNRSGWEYGNKMGFYWEIEGSGEQEQVYFTDKTEGSGHEMKLSADWVA